MQTWLPVIAALGFLASTGLALAGLRRGVPGQSGPQLAGMFVGFLALTGWLYLRGIEEGSCPLNSLFDVLVFLAWSVVLIYLLVGSTYRLSLMGAFTAPLALAFLAVAFLAPIPREPVPRAVPDPWIEMHAALSLVAYGCFALAGVAGAMYLLQEHQLKAARFSSLMQNLPPIRDLALVNARLMAWGLGLLTASFAAGLLSGAPTNNVKMVTSLVIWTAYAAILAGNRLRALTGRRLAAASVSIFALALVTLPAIQHFSTPR